MLHRERLEFNAFYIKSQLESTHVFLNDKLIRDSAMWIIKQ